MKRTFAERRVYDGAKVTRGYRVTSIEVCKETPGTVPKEIVRVESHDEYSSGCKLHPRCIGHMCVTPAGSLLPFHGLALSTADILTQYTYATMEAFREDSSGYKRKLEETNKGKHGHLRSVLKTPVSGSARLVATPHTDSEIGHVYMSSHLASKLNFCAVETLEDKSVSMTYSERCLREGDYVILGRPPSLSIYNNQPLKVKFWSRETIGVHPEVFSHLGGDYDGDEAHVYPLSLPSSIKEAESWVVPPFPKFDKARQMFSSLGLGNPISRNLRGDMEFIQYTTLSASQMCLAKDTLELGDLTRNSDKFVFMLGDRMNDKTCASKFVEDAIQGVKDVMRQQLGQGSIGYLTRVAKIAMMNIVRSIDGGTYVITPTGRELLLDYTMPSVGSPSVRATMSLCGVAQQSALNAHKVGEVASTSFDFVSSLFLGRYSNSVSKYPASTPVNTLFVMSKDTPTYVVDQMKPMWKYFNDTQGIVIASDDYSGPGLKYCIGAYSPVVLAALRQPYVATVSLCLRALRVVYSYNGVGVEGDDLVDVAAGFSYEVGSSTLPITCSEGLSKRNLGWVERAMGSDLRVLGQVGGDISIPLSSTSATVMSNFRLLEDF